MNDRPGRAVYAAMMAASVGGISYEVILMRLFSVESSSSFGYMFISIAMLAVGMSGTLVTVFRDAALRHRNLLLGATSMAAVLLVALSTFGTHLVPFVPLKILEDPKQFLYVAYFYGLFFLPFFASSSFIALALSTWADDVDRLYFFDLIGAAVGGLAAVLGSYVLAPEHLPALAAAMFGLVHVLVIAPHPRGRKAALVTVPIVLAAVASIPLCNVRQVSEFKGISYALATAEVSGAHVVARRTGPLGLLEVVESTVERSAPGLSSNTPEDVVPPVEHGLYCDGSKLGPLSRDPGAAGSACLDWLVSATPYAVRPAKSVALLGVGGGGAIREALHHGAERVTGVELNPQVLDLLGDEFASYAGGLLARPGVSTVVADGRAWAETTDDRYDLVVLNLLDVSGLSFSWSTGASEDYLHTVEAFLAYARVLAPGGLVAVPVRLNEPARGDLKALATAIRAAQASATVAPEHAVAFLRETFFGIVLLKPDGFSTDETARLKGFAEDKGFDLSWADGLAEADVNRFTELPDEAYWRMARAAFSSPSGLDDFVASYPFDVAPTYDDRPYFGSYFRPEVLDYYRANAQEPDRWWREIPVDLWSYPMLVVILVQSIVFGALIVLFPLLVARRSLGRARGKGLVIVYFACLGAGYMFAEMVFIQKLTLVLANPISSAAVVLSGMLTLSGIGAFVSGRAKARRSRTLLIAFAVVAANCLILAVLPLAWIRPLVLLPMVARVPAALALIAPASFFLGFFFPLGIDAIHRREPGLVGWAFGINGAVSVPAISGAGLATLHFGFTPVLVAVCFLYLAAWLVSRHLGNGGE